MFIDRLDNWDPYFDAEAWETAFDFLLSVQPDAEEKKYPLQGDDIYALVMSYDTRAPEEGLLEAHEQYVDIQALLTGREAIEWALVDDLEVETPYDASKDAVMLKRPEQRQAVVSIYPGTFVALLPQDAHMPGLMVGHAPERVKKVVVKIKLDLLSPYEVE